ncbi:N-methylhydantoinase A/acetone carboxylase beta subunit-like protein [Desulforamulus reducens MI-1]|uniref:N-methylhydantoinase A/acetone carboxylase beta subunit-like protein n=1 Tax=Desulforamulus reducens (strain ATCC BAA-1160 / DSM 100696 / MI-1) TaxID=349161 RepID=A4J4R7_DESRM|nr:N-methylhydantoinase A/acetone carboxylase subunit beta-like protein [Desulforamulus reducens]ABO50070.1 N-methylhydantoinase A/acetone carboxylase beta subunit-like protein [Desulforamulus reducens MI-1]
MNYSISFLIEEKHISGLLAMEDLIIATTRLAYEDLAYALNNGLNQLLKQTFINPQEIKTIFITTDFLNLFGVGKIIKHRIGYIRYLPKITRNNPPLEHSPLAKLIETATVDSFESLEAAIKSMGKKKINLLAINPSFFSWRYLTKQTVSPLVEKHLGPLPIVMGTIFNKIGYTERENLLLTNALLVLGVGQFYDQLAKAMGSLGITAKILTLRSNGMLMTESKARQYPIYTVKAPLAACFLSSEHPFSRYVIKVIEGDKQLVFGMTEKGLPHAPMAPLHCQQVPLKLSHPYTQSIPLPAKQPYDDLREAIKEILASFNMADESLPVVLQVNQRELKTLLFRICQRLYLPVWEAANSSQTGVLVAPICLEHECYLSDYTGPRRSEIQAALWEKLYQELQSENLTSLGEWSKFWDERYIRYLPEQAALIRFGLFSRCK